MWAKAGSTAGPSPKRASQPQPQPTWVGLNRIGQPVLGFGAVVLALLAVLQRHWVSFGELVCQVSRPLRIPRQTCHNLPHGVLPGPGVGGAQWLTVYRLTRHWPKQTRAVREAPTPAGPSHLKYLRMGSQATSRITMEESSSRRALMAEM